MKTILRTPDEAFANLPGYDFAPNYIEIEDTRIHYIDEGENRDSVVLCLHGEPSWSYLYRKMIPTLSREHRVIVPDLVGFGKSDKYADEDDYTYEMHFNKLQLFIEKLDLKNITVVVQDWGGLLGLPLAALNPDRFEKLVIMNTGLPSDEAMGDLMSAQGLLTGLSFLAWRTFSQYSPYFDIGQIVSMGTYPRLGLSDEIVAAYNAPFPDKSYKAGARKFPALVPMLPNMEARAYTERAVEIFKSWTKPTLVMFSDKDPITGSQAKFFKDLIPGAAGVPEIVIHDAGHFLQEDKGEEIAENIVRFAAATS